MIGPLPSSQQAIAASGAGGQAFVTPVWQRWFNSFLQSPPAPSEQTVGASPASFTANFAGNFLVTGGTVSSIVLQRGTSTTTLGVTSGFIPVSIFDRIVVTYAVAPTVTFIPS